MTRLVVRFPAPNKNGCFAFWVGELEFTDAFFHTIAYRLEDSRWGNRFPVVMRDLYDGRVGVEHISELEQELKQIRQEFKSLNPDQVVVDMNNLNKQLPWGKNISHEITDMSNYFVTCDGKQLFDNLFKAIDCAKRLHMPLHLASSHDDIQDLD